MGKDKKKTIARINELGKRFDLLTTTESVELWELLYDESIRDHIYNRIVNKQESSLQETDFDDGYNIAAVEFLEKVDAETLRGKTFFNYFMFIVEKRLIDKYRTGKKRPKKAKKDDDGRADSGYVSRTVSLDASVDNKDEDESFTLHDLVPSNVSVENEVIAEETNRTSGELLLYLCHLTVNLNRHRPGISEEQRRKAICYRLLFSNETVAVLRNGYARGSVFARHERDFMDSLDLNLTDFTYCTPPKNLPEISTGRLKTYRQMGLEGRKMDGEPHLPFIAKVLLAVLSSAYDIQLTTARLSQLGKEWNAYMSAEAAEAMK